MLENESICENLKSASKNYPLAFQKGFKKEIIRVTVVAVMSVPPPSRNMPMTRSSMHSPSTRSHTDFSRMNPAAMTRAEFNPGGRTAMTRSHSQFGRGGGALPSTASQFARQNSANFPPTRTRSQFNNNTYQPMMMTRAPFDPAAITRAPFDYDPTMMTRAPFDDYHEPAMMTRAPFDNYHDPTAMTHSPFDDFHDPRMMPSTRSSFPGRAPATRTQFPMPVYNRF